LSQTSRSVDHGTAIYNGDEDELEHHESWSFVKMFIRKARSRSYRKEVDEQHQHGGGCDEMKTNKDKDASDNKEKKDNVMDDNEEYIQFFLNFDDTIDPA
jgi:hypothetical protein